jgi:hypothetical protein
LNTTPQALALAWVARNSNTSTVILGASSADQLRENLKAVEVLPKLTPEIMEKIEAILANKPEAPVSHNALLQRGASDLMDLFSFSFFFFMVDSPTIAGRYLIHSDVRGCTFEGKHGEDKRSCF